MEPKKRAHYPELAKEGIINSHLRPNSENRVWAKVTDVFLIQSAGYMTTWFVHFFTPWLSNIAAIFIMGFLWASIDRINSGQSPGKWLFGLHTIESRRGAKPKYYQSFVRNTAFYSLNIGIFLLNSFIGKIFFVIGLSCVFFELYCIFQVRSGVRVGDIVGATRVFDFKDEHTKFIEQYLKEENNPGF